MKTTFRDLRHRLLDALLFACSPVEALLNLDDPKFKVNNRVFGWVIVICGVEIVYMRVSGLLG